MLKIYEKYTHSPLSNAVWFLFKTILFQINNQSCLKRNIRRLYNVKKIFVKSVFQEFKVNKLKEDGNRKEEIPVSSEAIAPTKKISGRVRFVSNLTAKIVG